MTKMELLSNINWDFGDGTNSTQKNPTHTYKKDGIYVVTLTVVDNDGLSDSKTKLINIGKSTIPSVPIPPYIEIFIIISTIFCFFQIIRGLK